MDGAWLPLLSQDGCWLLLVPRNCIAMGNCTPVLCALLIFQLKETFSAETETEAENSPPALARNNAKLYNYLFILQRRAHPSSFIHPFRNPPTTLCTIIIQM